MTGPAFMSAGAFIGVSVAAPVGPIGILCIKRTLAHGMGIGLSTGAGATTVQLCYGTLLLLSMDEIGPLLTSYQRALSLAGAALMVVFAWRIGRSRRPLPRHRQTQTGSAIVAYISAVALNLTNPLGFVLLTASVTTLLGSTPPSGSEAAWVLFGLALGSLGWWISLTGVTTILRHRLPYRVVTAINQVTAVALAGLGLLTIARALGQ
jgi:threonine/homoserine/homoserine lactone efflux protein